MSRLIVGVFFAGSLAICTTVQSQEFQVDNNFVFKGKLSSSYVQKDLKSNRYYTVYVFCDLDEIYSMNFGDKCFSVASYFARAPNQMYPSHLLEPYKESEYIVFLDSSVNYYHPFIRVFSVYRGDVYYYNTEVGAKFDYFSGEVVYSPTPDTYDDFKLKLIMYFREHKLNFYMDRDWGINFPEYYRPQLVDKNFMENCNLCVNRMKRGDSEKR